MIDPFTLKYLTTGFLELPVVLTSSLEKWIYVKLSGTCESMTPCGLQAQPLESLVGGASLYWFKP